MSRRTVSSTREEKGSSEETYANKVIQAAKEPGLRPYHNPYPRAQTLAKREQSTRSNKNQYDMCGRQCNSIADFDLTGHLVWPRAVLMNN
ncbi:uncharacterized protein [Zea mays]|uniref:uncharacterized protein isoform X2 n=1 Tax=Zea mays TaxID=4577 RepID=UPI0009AA0A5A|nr:uncharacterized protein LOC100277477 isoform X2 [Zea mays]|eukprot:XP_020408125.1 uncharacterized protein LOC100277477 isoform X2 [Zea mays]